MNYGIILGGGLGLRTGLPIPKQYTVINGHEVIEYSIRAFNESKNIDEFVVISESEDRRRYLHEKYGITAILGGKTRNYSFYNGLKFIEKQQVDCNKVFINEAARPMITAKIIDDMFKLSDNKACVYCTKPITDSLENIDGEYIDRSDYRLVMSPEIYDYKTIVRYFNPDSRTTFPGHMLPANISKVEYKEFMNNYKITYKEDIHLLEGWLSSPRC